MKKLIAPFLLAVFASVTQAEATEILLTCALSVNDDVANGKEIDLIIEDHRVIERGEDRHATWIEIGTRQIKFVEENKVSRWVWRIDRMTGVFTIDKVSSSLWGPSREKAVGRCAATKATPNRF
jgi:hypothetical protein